MRVMDNATVIVDCGEGIKASAVVVRWEGVPVVVGSEAAARMDACWEGCLQAAAAQGRKLFDGAITRLMEVRREGNQIVLTVGPGSYKAFMVTRLRDRAWFEAHVPKAVTRALGNSVLLTHKDAALLGVRSSGVSCYAGRAHLIGGVLEALDTVEFPANVEGLIGHLMLELREEAGVGPEDLEPRGTWPRMLGVLEDDVLGQPEAIWRWETRTDLQEIARRLDAAEHAGYLIVRRGGIGEEILSRMTPVARAAYGMWTRGV